MASLALAFDILARDKGASATFNKVGDSADRAGKKGKSFGSLMKGAAAIASGAFAAAGIAQIISGVTHALGDSIAEAREAEKVGKTTAQIIKSTGGAAKVSADQVGSLAEAISNKTGIDDEAIQSGSNLLLTFKKVRNEVGQGANIFDRATQAATDLSAAGFGSIEGSSKMLGKALNDPVKGLTALGRAGVQFTDQQKEQIKTLVKSGDTLGAQKIILGEVESQVGGVAAASSTMGEKVKTAFNNVKEKIGTALLPVLDEAGQAVLALMDGFTTGEVSTDGFAGKMMELGAFVKNSVIPTIQRLWGWVSQSLFPALQKGANVILPALKQALSTVTGGVGEGTVSWKKIGEVITQKVIPFVAKMISYYLPVLAANIRSAIEVVKVLYGTFQTWKSIVGSVISFILGKFADLSSMWASVLHALGRVPGFGWAKDAADKLDRAAGKARAVKDAIDGIPRNVQISVGMVTSGRVTVAGKKVNLGQIGDPPVKRAQGGPTTTGRLYQVGDNKDGSWNNTTELFRPSGPGRVVNQDEMRKALGVAESQTAGRMDFSEATLQRLAAMLSGVRTQAVVRAGSLDAAFGSVLR